MSKIYNSSSGPKVIADMNPHNVKKAHAKLLRDEPRREQEIADLAEQMEINDAEYARTHPDEGNAERSYKPGDVVE